MGGETEGREREALTGGLMSSWRLVFLFWCAQSDVDSTEVVVPWEAARASVTLQQFMLATVEGRRGQQRMRGLELRVNVDGKYLVKVSQAAARHTAVTRPRCVSGTLSGWLSG